MTILMFESGAIAFISVIDYDKRAEQYANDRKKDQGTEDQSGHDTEKFGKGIGDLSVGGWNV